MGLQDEILKFGAKGAFLDYIHRQDPSIPIEPYVLVPVNGDWRDYESQIQTLGEKTLVRSSSPLEDGKELSFAGLFWTEDFYGQNSVDSVMESIDDLYTQMYVRNHNVTTPIEMGLTFQRDSKSGWNWGIIRHPHQENLLFIQGRPVPDRYSHSENLVYDENTGEAYEIEDLALKRVFSRVRLETEDLDEQVREAIEIYKRIEAMPEFQTGYTYHMEFGTEPISVFQFRPFRKKSKPTWNLEDITFDEEKYHVTGYGFSFGMTPPDGIELNYVRSISTHQHESPIEEYRKLLAKMPKEKAVKKLYKMWDRINENERAYVEEIAKIDPNSFGDEIDAFDRAVMRLSEQWGGDNACLIRENMHFNHGTPIDLLFPKAKVWIASGGLQFLSHDWFRAMQTYPICLLGRSSLNQKTGDKVKVYSDGLIGKVLESQ